MEDNGRHLVRAKYAFLYPYSKSKYVPLLLILILTLSPFFNPTSVSASTSLSFSPPAPFLYNTDDIQTIPFLVLWTPAS